MLPLKHIVQDDLATLFRVSPATAAHYARTFTEARDPGLWPLPGRGRLPLLHGPHLTAFLLALAGGPAFRATETATTLRGLRIVSLHCPGKEQRRFVGGKLEAPTAIAGVAIHETLGQTIADYIGGEALAQPPQKRQFRVRLEPSDGLAVRACVQIIDEPNVYLIWYSSIGTSTSETKDTAEYDEGRPFDRSVTIRDRVFRGLAEILVSAQAGAKNAGPADVPPSADPKSGHHDAHERTARHTKSQSDECESEIQARRGGPPDYGEDHHDAERFCAPGRVAA